MAFGVAIVVTNIGKAMFADRLRTSPATYTASPKYLALGTGATGAARTAAATDTALSTPADSRAAGTESTVTTTNAGDTYQDDATVTAGANRAYDEYGLFDASSSGNMGLSGTMNVINIPSGSSLEMTIKIQQT